MPQEQKLKVMILAKASPVVTSKLQEDVCVAAIDLSSKPRWIRLYPVPFRDLDDNSRFRKYQEISVRVIRPRNDRRPESWRPILESITPGVSLGTERNWAARHERIASLGEQIMCELIERNRSETSSAQAVSTLQCFI